MLTTRNSGSTAIPPRVGPNTVAEYRAVHRRLVRRFGPIRPVGSGRGTSPRSSRRRSRKKRGAGVDLPGQLLCCTLFKTALRENFVDQSPRGQRGTAEGHPEAVEDPAARRVARVAKAFTETKPARCS